VTVFKPHLLNKLTNQKGYKSKTAEAMLLRAVKKFDSVIYECLCELITDSPYPDGIPIIMNRNPSLHQGSAMFSYISLFKPDIEDLSLSTSILTAANMNADYDGDVPLSA